MWEQNQDDELFSKICDDSWYIRANTSYGANVVCNFIATIEDSFVYNFYMIGMTYNDSTYYIKISVNDKLVFNNSIGSYSARTMLLQSISAPLIKGENKINISFKTHNSNSNLLLKLPPVEFEKIE